MQNLQVLSSKLAFFNQTVTKHGGQMKGRKRKKEKKKQEEEEEE